MLEIQPAHFLSTDYAVTVGGAPLTRVVDTHGPLAATFQCNGVRYRVDPLRRQAGLLATIGQAIVDVVTRSRAWQLGTGRAQPLAVARERGFRTPGFDVELGSARAALDPLTDATGFLWRGPGGDGRLERLGFRGVRASLPDTLDPPLQIFAALLALSTWETVSTGGGD